MIALSALGNLVGDIYTNARGEIWFISWFVDLELDSVSRARLSGNAKSVWTVKREIAQSGLIPLSSYFAKSSSYGLLREEIGTPTGGLILHGLVSCVFITAVPFLPGSLEGLNFMTNTYVYGHSVLNIALAVGSLFPLIIFRMNATQTAKIDGELLFPHSQTAWDWQILKWRYYRWLTSVFLLLFNGFLVGLPFASSPNPDGTPRRIPTWRLPVSVLSLYFAGAVAGVLMVAISRRMVFRNSPAGSELITIENWVHPKSRQWMIEYPPVSPCHNPISLD